MKLPVTTPDRKGPHGLAWKHDLAAIEQKHLGKLRAPAELTVASWVVHAPYAHPVWHSYLIACVSLRNVAGVPPAKINLPGATHEVMVYALNPDHPVTIDDLPHVLQPANFHGQFIEPSDEAAAARVDQTVQDVIDARLSPDTDYARHWIHRFSDSNVLDKEHVGETRIVTEQPDGTVHELVIPAQPGPQDMH